MSTIYTLYALMVLGSLYVTSSEMLYDMFPEDAEAYQSPRKRAMAEIFERKSRSPTCGCCVQSRMTSQFCCDLCTNVVKRSQPQDPGTSLEPLYPEKRMSSSCFCCKATMNAKCCGNCRFFV